MAGRKRKMLSAAAAAPEATINHESHGDVKDPPAKLKSIHCEHVSGAEVRSETSCYFQKNPDHRLGEGFFNQPCVSLAKAFLGRVLVRRCADGTELRGRIVETEAYLGGEDKASHSAGGKRTERNTAMFMKPGTIYVYSIYGVYLCMNVSSQGEGAAVLLRSLEPLQGQPLMRQLRAARRRDGARQLKDKELCNGPSKLCQALNIPRCFDRRDLASDPEVWLERDPHTNPLESHDVVSASRIGIESHGEWANKPLRFYLLGHRCVSVVNKEAERLSAEMKADLNSSDVQSDTGQQHLIT